MGYLVALLVYLGIGAVIADRFFRRRHGVPMKRGRGLAGLDAGLMGWGAVLFTWPVATWLPSVREPALCGHDHHLLERDKVRQQHALIDEPPADECRALADSYVYQLPTENIIMANINESDRVITAVDLGSGTGKGTKGTVTHVSVFHGLATVRFDTDKEVTAVKLHHLSLN